MILDRHSGKAEYRKMLAIIQISCLPNQHSFYRSWRNYFYNNNSLKHQIYLHGRGIIKIKGKPLQLGLRRSGP